MDVDDDPIDWTAPAGGRWDLESAHVHGGQPRVFQERAPRAFRTGFARSATRYGLPIDYLDTRFVNDHCYVRMRPIGAPEPRPGSPSTPPPALVLKVLSRLHPELRRRERTAKHALAAKVWHEDREQWQRHDRDAMLRANRSLQAERPDRLDDLALGDHVRRAAAHFEHGVTMHFQLIPVHDITVGRFLLACRQWDIDATEATALLAGSSPASRRSAVGLAAIARACAAARVTPSTLEDVRAASPSAATALDDYLDEHGWRIVTQYSPRGRALIELPDVIVKAIHAASDEVPDSPAPDEGPLRDRVSAVERTAFDELLVDARACCGVRDDNVALTFLWPTGLLRRALLEAGRRLAEHGRLAHDSHVFVLGEDEIVRALAGDASMREVAATRDARLRAAERDGAPSQLGDDEGPPPDPGLFPKAMAELVRSIMLPFELETEALPQQDIHTARTDVTMRPDANWTGSGHGIGTQRYTGRACVADSAEQAVDRLQPGDVLVTTFTTPAFEAIIPIAGAVVTDRGGVTSHTALVCRECGIPAVVGATGATVRIADRSIVTVDPSTGRVFVEQTAGRS